MVMITKEFAKESINDELGSAYDRLRYIHDFAIYAKEWGENLSYRDFKDFINKIIKITKKYK